MGQRAADAKRKAPGAERRGTEEQGTAGSGQAAAGSGHETAGAQATLGGGDRESGRGNSGQAAAGNTGDKTAGSGQLAANTKQDRRRGAGRAGDGPSGPHAPSSARPIPCLALGDGPVIDPMRPALRLPQATRARASGTVYAAVLPAGEGPRGGAGPNGLTWAFLTSHENIFADVHSVAYVVAPIRLARSEG